MISLLYTNCCITNCIPTQHAILQSGFILGNCLFPAIHSQPPFSYPAGGVFTRLNSHLPSTPLARRPSPISSFPSLSRLFLPSFSNAITSANQSCALPHLVHIHCILLLQCRNLENTASQRSIITSLQRDNLPISFTPARNTMIPTATVKARAKKLLAMTTPFVQPPDCTDVFSTTDIVTSFDWGNYSETTLHVSISGPDGSRFTSCQPSGWANVKPQSRFNFSPAVCPSGWTAYHLEPFQTATPAITTAYCCARYGLGLHSSRLQILCLYSRHSHATAATRLTGIPSTSHRWASPTQHVGAKSGRLPLFQQQQKERYRKQRYRKQR